MAVSCSTDWRSLPALPVPALWGNVDSGVFRGNTALIESGTRVKVSLGLVIITEGDLVVEGEIVFDDPPTLPAGLAAATIALVSLAGKVVVGQNARVGGAGSAAPGTNITGRASATGTAGEGGGVVLLSGVSLGSRGWWRAIEGDAAATPRPMLSRSPRIPSGTSSTG
jgi:hypothetical protein